MADFRRLASGNIRIRWGKRSKSSDKRPTVVIGDVNRADAIAACRHIEHLVECKAVGADPGLKARDWLRSLSLKAHSKLAEHGLCEYRFEEESKTVGGLADHFMEWKSHIKASSKRRYQDAMDLMIESLGAGTDIRFITPADVDDLISHVYRKVAKTTASRMCSTIKSVFNRACRKRWIDRADLLDLFEGMPKQTRTNESRQYWVDAGVVKTVIEHATTNEQRLIFALGRWGGLRMPSELIEITWSDVDREREVITIRSPKQEEHEHKRERWIPIWPEIRPYLDEAYQEAKTHFPYVIARHRSSNTSAHSRLFKLACFRAKITSHRDELPWPKLWLNRRSTRATELRDLGHNAGQVNFWINHDEKTFEKHYSQWRNVDWRSGPTDHI